MKQTINLVWPKNDRRSWIRGSNKDRKNIQSVTWGSGDGLKMKAFGLLTIKLGKLFQMDITLIKKVTDEQHCVQRVLSECVNVGGEMRVRGGGVSRAIFTDSPAHSNLFSTFVALM